MTSPDPVASPLHTPAEYLNPRTADGLLPWSYARERLESARNYWLTTVRPNGRPHVTPLWGAWVGNALYFDGSPETRWGRNIATNPAASINLSNPDRAIIVEGTIEFVTTDDALAALLIAAWETKYGQYPPEPATRGIYLLSPTVARGWTHGDLRDGTRWTFTQ